MADSDCRRWRPDRPDHVASHLVAVFFRAHGGVDQASAWLRAPPARGSACLPRGLARRPHHALDLVVRQAEPDALISTFCSLPVFFVLARRAGCRWRRCRRSPRPAACRAAPADPGRGRTGRATCCRFAIALALETWTVTAVWLSSAVEKVWLALVGMVVFFSMSLVNTPPRSRCPATAGSRRAAARPDVAPQHAALDRGAHGHDLVRVHALAGPCRRTAAPPV